MVKGNKTSFKKKSYKASKRKSSFAKRVFSVINKQREMKVSAPNTVAITDVEKLFQQLLCLQIHCHFFHLFQLVLENNRE